MKKTAPVLVSVLSGAAIWAFSPLVTGEVEPWDSSSSYLLIAITLTSLMLGFVFPHHFAVSALGLTLGQMLYLGIFLPDGPLVIVGFLLLAGYGIMLSLPFTFIASLTRIQHRGKNPSYSAQHTKQDGISDGYKRPN